MCGPRRSAAAASPEHEALIERRLGNTRTHLVTDRRRGRKCPRVDGHGHRHALCRETGRRSIRGRSDKKTRSRRAERPRASGQTDAVADAFGPVRRSISANTGAISASRGAAAPSRHRCDSCPSHDDVGGFFFDFEAVRSRRWASRSCQRSWACSTRRTRRPGSIPWSFH